MVTRNVWVLMAFVLAEAGLVWRLLEPMTWAERLFTIAVILLGVDQARMAIVDLRNVQALMLVPTQIAPDPRLAWFYKITLSTIGLELLGFFVAWKHLGWGALLILLSQVWFNLLAGVQLFPNTDNSIQHFGVRDRLVVLLADGFGIGLISLWIAQIAPMGVAIGLLSMVLLYGFVKYGSALVAKLDEKKLDEEKSTNVNQ
jgi:hypothetical protein